MRYLAVPARPAPLILILVFAFGLTLAAHGGLLGLPLAILLLSWLFKYAFVVFDTVARGFLEPPVLSVEMVNPVDEQRPLGMLLIAGVFYGATKFLGAHVGEWFATALRTAGLLVLPAAVAVLGSTGRILDAINPVLLAGLVRRLGLHYLVLLGLAAAFVTLLLVTPGYELPLVLRLALLMYATLAMFSAIAGVLYERRAALGLETWRSPERTEARRAADAARDIDRAIDEIYAHWRSGAHSNAWRALQSQLAARGHAPEAYRALYERLARWPDPRLADRLAEDMAKMGTGPVSPEPGEGHGH